MVLKSLVAGRWSLVIAASIMLSSPAWAITEIKLAILAPEGSTWAKVVHEWDAALRAETHGRVGLKIYSGGVLGDERDVIRKMRIGQCHAAGFTGLGLGTISPEVRVLELPFLFENYAEVDHVASKLQPKLNQGFASKGFELLGWTETGFVNIFSNKPIAKRKDMDGMKMWAWEGDPLVEALYRRLGIVPVPLALPDVLTSLQTNLIDAVYAPPLGAIALQWFTRTRHITDAKIGYSTGAILITKQALALLPPADQRIFKDTAQKYARLLIERTRADNEKSYTTLQQAGLKTVFVSAEELSHIREASLPVWDDLIGKLYSKDLLDEVKAVLAEVRSAH